MRRTTRLMVIALTALWWVRLDARPKAASVPWPECDDVCTSETSCTDSCYVDEIAFENGDSISCFAYGTYASPCCGDEYCDAGEGENYSNCFADCHCGDGTCNAGENAGTCPADCSGGPPPPDCTGTCDDETCDDCPQDCATDTDVCGYCGDGVCEATETGGVGSAYDGHCDPSTDDWCSYCGADCGGGCVPTACWPYVCDPDETECTNCDDDGDCQAAYGDAFCTAWNVCMIGCTGDGDCRAGEICNDWDFDPPTCVPVGTPSGSH